MKCAFGFEVESDKICPKCHAYPHEGCQFCIGGPMEFAELCIATIMILIFVAAIWIVTTFLAQ